MASGVRTLSIAAALIAAGPAFAQEEVCSGGLNLAEFGAAMDMVDAAIAKPDVDDARYLLQQMHPKVPCLAVAAAPDAMTRYGALRATVAFFDQDESGVVQWGLMARYTAQDGDPFPGLPETHPLRDTLEFADEPPVSGPPGESLAPPKGGGVFLNGVLATQPLWRVEVPVLVQVFDKKERLVLSHWQDGAAFSDEILTSGTFPVDPPKWWLGPVIAPVEITTTSPFSSPDPALRPLPAVIRAPSSLVTGPSYPSHLPIRSRSGVALSRSSTRSCRADATLHWKRQRSPGISSGSITP